MLAVMALVAAQACFAAAVTGDSPMAVAETSRGLLLTNGSGSGLWLHDGEGTVCISPGRGSGAYAVERDGVVLFRECLEDCHRLVSATPGDGLTELLRAETVYGPFPAPEGLLVCLPRRILLIDATGAVLREWETEPFPSTACLLEGRLLYTTDDGLLHSDRLPAPGIDAHVLAVRAVPEANLAMVETAGGSLLFMNGAGDIAFRAANARFPTPSPGGAVWAELECRGAEAIGGRVIRAQAAEGRLDTLLRGVPAASPLIDGDGRLVYTDLRSGRISGTDVDRLRPSRGTERTDDPEAWLDLVPYMHQRWDTPDWFDGSWSCGPTSCMMAVQYYNRLTPDSIWCSYPSPGHWSEWGEYIPELYTFLGHTYDVWGVSPGNVWVQGAHGFICRDAGGAYWDYMVLWMQQHGLYSAWGGTGWDAFTSEVDQGWPMVASTTSEYTSGHILLFNGWFTDHSFVCNDSYGDQNEPGWGDYYNGEDVVYDWYPYDNGHVQIHVAQLFYARDSVLAAADTLVDDYSWGFEKLGPCQYWHEVDAGWHGNAWWTYSTAAPPDTCVARWNPQLPEPGEYDVYAFIPSQRATATGTYHLQTPSGWEEAVLDQSLYSDQWAHLGAFYVGTEPVLRLGDYTGTGGEYIAFDAVRFDRLQSSAEGEEAGLGPGELRVWPSPCRGPAVQVALPAGMSGARICVFDLSGRLVMQREAADGGPVALDVAGLAAGVYQVRGESAGAAASARLVILR
ncbi:MAG: C39 family peptidase [Candidatus Fermentibacteraceae bacterium]